MHVTETDACRSHTLLRGHQQRVDVLKALKLRLVDLLYNIIIVRRELNGLIGELGIKVIQPKLAGDVGLEGWNHLLLLHKIPVYISEKRMGHDVCKACLRVTSEALLWLLVEESLQHASGFNR